MLVDGYRCEDLERPTFEDASIDVIVSSDVFEHVVDVDAAHAQVARVLAEGGIHVWTTPQDRELASSRPRVRRTPEGMDFMEPEKYHDDPANARRALVTYDWGRDLPEQVEAASGLWTTVFRLESRAHGLLGEFLEVFVSHRGPIDTVAPDARKLAEPYIVDLERTQVDLELVRNDLELVRNDLEAARAELAESRQDLASVLGSRSWRVTGPIRVLSAAIRRGRGQR